jgi:hypothetical protein
MKIAVMFLLGLLVLSVMASASQPIVASKDISFDCAVEPEPRLGEKFTVTASFTFNEKTYYNREAGDKAVAIITIFWPQEYVSGDTIIEGYFDKGETFTLSATYRAVKNGICLIGGKVMTHEVDAFGQPDAKSYTNTSLDCAEYYLKDDKSNDSAEAPGRKTAYSISNPEDNDTQFPKPTYPGLIKGPDDRTDATCDSLHRYKREEIRRRKGGTLALGIIEIYVEKDIENDLYTTNDIKIAKPQSTRIIFRDHNTGSILYPEFPANDNDYGEIERFDDSIYIFKANDTTGNVLLEGSLDGKKFNLNCIISGIWELEGI